MRVKSWVPVEEVHWTPCHCAKKRVSTLAALIGSSELLALDGVARSSVLNASRSARADPLSEAAGPPG
eukprot:170267-Rhodomonas_salina.1